MSPGLSQSVQARLVAHAKTLGVDPNLVLARFATERLLYRLSRSRHADRFVLKGALLLLVWLKETIRPTRDADLLGFGDLSDDVLAATFAEICGTEVEPDGITFDASSIRVAAIRPEDDYGGQRVTLLGRLGPAASGCRSMSASATPCRLSPSGSSIRACSICRARAFGPTARKRRLPRRSTQWSCSAPRTAACGTFSTSTPWPCASRSKETL